MTSNKLEFQMTIENSLAKVAVRFENSSLGDSLINFSVALSSYIKSEIQFLYEYDNHNKKNCLYN